MLGAESVKLNCWRREPNGANTNGGSKEKIALKLALLPYNKNKGYDIRA